MVIGELESEDVFRLDEDALLSSQSVWSRQLGLLGLLCELLEVFASIVGLVHHSTPEIDFHNVISIV